MGYTKNGKISNSMQMASVRRYTLTEGRESGVKVIDCDNGCLRFLLNESNGLDVMQMYHKGQNVSFLSKNAFEGREIDFLNRFEGGMLYTCGLDNIGGREGQVLHGNYHCTPARVISAECKDGDIEVVAEVLSTALFGKNLRFVRKITSAYGSDTLCVEDTLINEDYSDGEYCLLYHVNVGYPMLDEGAVVVADVLQSEPRDCNAEANAAKAFNMEGDTPLIPENCYYLTLGKPEVTLRNEKLGKAFTVRYSKETLPCFVEWKSMASGDYALGLEPCTSQLDAKFEKKTIKAGESIEFKVSLTVSEI